MTHVLASVSATVLDCYTLYAVDTGSSTEGEIHGNSSCEIQLVIHYRDV